MCWGGKCGPKPSVTLYTDGTPQTAITDPMHVEKGSIFYDQMTNAILKQPCALQCNDLRCGNMIQWENKCFGAKRPLPFTSFSFCHNFLICKIGTIPISQHFYEDGKKISKVICIW